MALRKKHRRSMVVDGRRFLWWIAEDEASPFSPCLLALTVASEERRILVRYHLEQPDELRHITVLGPEFREVGGCGGPWKRFRCPAFGGPDGVRPLDVEALIRWCAIRGEPTVEVDYGGMPVTAG